MAIGVEKLVGITQGKIILSRHFAGFLQTIFFRYNGMKEAILALFQCPKCHWIAHLSTRKTLLYSLNQTILSLNDRERGRSSEALKASIKGGKLCTRLTHLRGFWFRRLFFTPVKWYHLRFWLDVLFFWRDKNSVSSSDWL